MANNVLITGFGPFGEHKINASWQAVRLVPTQNTLDNVNIIIEEIPVIYNVIDNLIPTLWKKHDPMLVVHVGVSAYTNDIKIETQAYRTGYIKTDCIGGEHQTNEACPANKGADCVKTLLDVDKICRYVNGDTEAKISTSNNAGRYLCEYTFYKSLAIDAKRTLFVHVPRLNEPYTADELAKALICIIKCALKQLISN